MVNKRRLDGRWIRFYRDKINLLPVLGRYNTSQAEQSRRRVSVPDFPQRDIFTSRVRSSAVFISDVPDINRLRRQGLCLATEDEVLGSLRLTGRHINTKPRPFNMPNDRPRVDSSLTTSTATTSDFISHSSVDHRRRSMMLHQLENEKRNATQRELESRIMKSKEYFYKTLSRENTSISHADGVTRKFVSEALDPRRRELLFKLERPVDETVDKDRRQSMFQEWKNSAMCVVDQQAEDDLKMVAEYKKIIRKSIFEKLKRQRRQSEPLAQVVDSVRESIVSGATLDDIGSLKWNEKKVSESQDSKKDTPRKQSVAIKEVNSRSRNTSLASVLTARLRDSIKPSSSDNN